MNNYKHITACNKPFPDIWTGAWKLKPGIHSSTSCLVVCCLLTKPFSYRPGSELNAPGSNKQQQQQIIIQQFSPHQYSARTWQFYMIWKIQHEMNTVQKTKYSYKSTVLWFSCCWMYRLVYLYFFEHLGISISINSNCSFIEHIVENNDLTDSFEFWKSLLSNLNDTFISSYQKKLKE